MSIPYYFASMGLPMSFIVFLGVGMINYYTLNLLFYLSRKHGKRTFAELAGHGLGASDFL